MRITLIGDVDNLDELFFFFQAEDGIRVHCVTGVQTFALPICLDVVVAGGSAIHAVVMDALA